MGKSINEGGSNDYLDRRPGSGADKGVKLRVNTQRETKRHYSERKGEGELFRR